MTLREALLGCSTGQLRRIADAWGVPPDPSLLRRELVELIFERVIGAIGERGFWAGLGDVEARVLQRLVRARGHHESGLLERRLTASTPGDDGAAGAVAEAVERLAARGLVFRVFEAQGAQRSTALVLPGEVLSAAEARLAPEPSALGDALAAEPPHVSRCDLAFDLFVLASALRREAQAAGSRALAGRPARTVAQVLAALETSAADGPGEPGRRWRFLLWVGKRAGWFSDRGWPVPDDEQVERLLGDRRVIVQEALAAAGPEPSAREKEQRPPDLLALHADGLQVLSELEPGAWWPADAVLGHLLAEAGPPLADDDGRAARRAEEALKRWLAGRWFWLGIVAWGQSEGGWALVAKQADSAAPVVPCAMAGDFHLAASPSADLRALYRCERYLAYRGTEDGTRRYDLTPATVARGLRLGGDDLELRSLLASLLKTEPPPAWIEAIERWAHPSSPLRLEPRVLLVARDAGELDAALDSQAARPAIAARLSERHAVVALDRVADLLAALAEAGQPVEVDAALRVDPKRPAQAASLGGGAVEAAWVALDVLRRLGPEVFGEQRDLVAAIASLEAVLPAVRLEVLERRARTIVGQLSERRGPRTRTGRRRRLS